MYVAPTTAEIEAQIISRIETGIGQTIPILPVAFVRVLAKAIAGALSLWYKFVAWVYRQISPQTADEEALLYLGDQYGLVRHPSVAAELEITISGDSGTSIPAGTLWVVGDQVYDQAVAAVIDGGSATVEVEALVAGSAGNQVNGTALVPPSPIAGVSGTVVASTITEGADEESLDVYRARVIARMRFQPQGGSAADYVAWALEVTGIVEAFAYRVGTDVVVYPLIATTGASHIPGAPKLAEVQAYLQAPERRPLCATVYALAATERTVDVTVTGLSPADAATKANIVSAIEAYLYQRRARQYTDEPLSTEKIDVAALWAAVNAAGAGATDVVMTISGIGTASTYTLPAGELAKPGTVSWA